MCDNAKECEAARRQGFAGRARRAMASDRGAVTWLPGERARTEARIREARPADAAAIRTVNESAFETPAEADLVEALDAGGFTEASLVAIADAMVVGHVVLSRVLVVPEATAEPDSRAAPAPVTPALSLAPVAVRPAYQGRGIGGQLVTASLDWAREHDWSLVTVLGHAEYYPRFGFVPASPHGILPPWPDIPSEAWMLAELAPGAAKRARGVVQFPPPFDDV